MEKSPLSTQNNQQIINIYKSNFFKSLLFDPSNISTYTIYRMRHSLDSLLSETQNSPEIKSSVTHKPLQQDSDYDEESNARESLNLDLDDNDDDDSQINLYGHLNGRHDVFLPHREIQFEDFSRTEKMFMYTSIALVLINTVCGSVLLSVL